MAGMGVFDYSAQGQLPGSRFSGSSARSGRRAPACARTPWSGVGQRAAAALTEIPGVRAVIADDANAIA
jgi:hypothetical protein